MSGLPGTTTRAGVFRVAASGAGESAALAGLLDTFVRALEAGMFPPAVLDARTAPQPGEGLVGIAFRGEGVPDAAFRVLAGMLTWFSQVVGPLGPRGAMLDGVQGNLLNTTAPLPPWPDPLPFATDLEVPQGVAPPLVVRIQLRQAVPEAEREALLRQVEVWHALLQGGYPREDDREGESGSGPATFRFDSPRTLVASSENWRADERCFAPLFNLLVRWGRQGVPVEQVSIE